MIKRTKDIFNKNLDNFIDFSREYLYDDSVIEWVHERMLEREEKISDFIYHTGYLAIIAATALFGASEINSLVGKVNETPVSAPVKISAEECGSNCEHNYFPIYKNNSRLETN